MTDVRKWRARSASDKTDDWGFWYLTDDKPADRNKTREALTLVCKEGALPPHSLPFISRANAEAIAVVLNELEGNRWEKTK